MKTLLLRYTAAGAGITALLLVTAAFILPLPAAFLPLFTEQLSDFSFGKLWPAVRFTFLQAGASTIIALLIGLPGAFFIARRKFPGRNFFSALSAVPLCVPPILIALGFVLFYGRQGVLNRLLMSVFSLKDPPITFLYSFWGIVITHGFYDFPVIMRMTSDLWQRLPPEEADAARILGASEFRIFRTITVRQLAPAIGAGCTLVFLYCFFSFVIVLLFGAIGGTTIEVEIYQAARSTLNFPLAAALALIETTCALCIVFLYGKLERKAAGHSRGLRRPAEPEPLRGNREKSLAAVYFLFILLFFIGPLIAIAWNSFKQAGYNGGTNLTVGTWKTLFTRPGFSTALIHTILIGLGTALLSSAAAVTCALLFRFRGKTASVFPMIPMAVSSVVLGLGWTLLVPRGTPLVLILAQSCMAWPFAYKQISSALDRVPAPIIDAARVLSPSPIHIVFSIYLPLCARGIYTGGAFAFAISAGDAALPLMLSIQNFDTLALYLYRLAGSYRFTEACACGVILAVMTSIIFLVRDKKIGVSS